MINGKKVLTIIPARGGSKGLPNKNKRILYGKPLVSYPIEVAKNSKYIDEVYLSTDDRDIQNIGIESGVNCPELRPKELASDTATTFSVLEYIIKKYKSKKTIFDYLLLLEPTSPLTQSEDVDSAIEKLDKNREKADSIVGITKAETVHPEFCVELNKAGILKPYKNDFSNVRRQDLDDVFFYDGSLYISDINALIKEESFYHSRTMGYITKKWQSLEIDDIIDFYCVESILENLEEIKSYE